MPDTGQQPEALLRSVSISTVGVDRAEILESGRVIGHTPFHQQRPLGRSYEWTLRAEGYEDKKIQFKVREIDNVFSPQLQAKERQR